MTKHATVRIGEYVIPLIGIHEDATQSECESCGRMTHISDLKLVGDRFVCERCGEEEGETL